MALLNNMFLFSMPTRRFVSPRDFDSPHPRRARGEVSALAPRRDASPICEPHGKGPSVPELGRLRGAVWRWFGVAGAVLALPLQPHARAGRWAPTNLRSQRGRWPARKEPAGAQLTSVERHLPTTGGEEQQRRPPPYPGGLAQSGLCHNVRCQAS